MKSLMQLLVCFLLIAGSASATPIGTTNPALFNDFVSWAQLGSDGTLGSFSSWISNGGKTGSLLVSPQYELLTQGSTWNGNFATGQSLVWNMGSSDGTFEAIFWNPATFVTQPIYGAGVYIQANESGPFTATVNVYDSSFNQLGSSFSAVGDSTTTPGTALFIGMLDTLPEISAIDFRISDQSGLNNFAIGTMMLSTTAADDNDGEDHGGGGTPVPEPSSYLLLGTGMAGILLMGRRSKTTH